MGTGSSSYSLIKIQQYSFWTKKLSKSNHFTVLTSGNIFGFKDSSEKYQIEIATTALI